MLPVLMPLVAANAVRDPAGKSALLLCMNTTQQVAGALGGFCGNIRSHINRCLGMIFLALVLLFLFSAKQNKDQFRDESGYPIIPVSLTALVAMFCLLVSSLELGIRNAINSLEL